MTAAATKGRGTDFVACTMGEMDTFGLTFRGS